MVRTEKPHRDAVCMKPCSVIRTGKLHRYEVCDVLRAGKPHERRISAGPDKDSQDMVLSGFWV